MEHEKKRIIEISLAKIEDSKSRKTNGKHYTHSLLHKNLMVSSLLSKALRNTDEVVNKPLMEYRESKIMDFDLDDMECSSFSQFLPCDGKKSRSSGLETTRSQVVKQISYGCDVFSSTSEKCRTDRSSNDSKPMDISRIEPLMENCNLPVDSCRVRGKRMSEDSLFGCDSPSPCKRSRTTTEEKENCDVSANDIGEAMDTSTVSSLTTLLGSSFGELRARSRQLSSDDYSGHLPSFPFEKPAVNRWPCVTVMAC